MNRRNHQEVEFTLYLARGRFLGVVVKHELVEKYFVLKPLDEIDNLPV